MNFEQSEQVNGWRHVFNSLPATKNMAMKAIMPMGSFYSPFAAPAEGSMKGKPSECSKCKGVLNISCHKDRQMKKWVCNFCSQDNPYLSDTGNKTVEEYYEGKAGDCGIYLLVDLCISKKEMVGVKETLMKTIEKLPKNIFVGLIIFNKNVHIADFSGKRVQYVSLSGANNYSANNFADLYQILGLVSKGDPRHQTQVICSKYYIPISKHIEKLMEAIDDLQADSHYVARQLREMRATGAALQVGIQTMSLVGINTRFVCVLGGPCTSGPGQVVDLPLKNTIRVYMDIIEGNQNTTYLKSATTFYEGLEKIIIDNKCTLDIWAYGLDQFGLYEMKNMCNRSGGMMAMWEQFDHYIFRESFERFYSANESGMFDFPFATQLRIRVSKQLRLNGILGTVKSLRQNTLKTASEMQIGQGGTNEWYLGGISLTNALCLILSHSEHAISENKTKFCTLQAITTYKFSDNVIRTKVSTININFVREVQFKDLIRGFDELAAVVMMARLGSTKAQIEEPMEVKKWIDRMLLKFTVKFANYSPKNTASFRLPELVKVFPQYMYHLRRSGLINPFGSPPDQTIYMRTCLMRESLVNCRVMIQSDLLKYTIDQPEAESVEMDFKELKEDVVLLMDSYFTVIVWNGQNIRGWKEQKLNEDPEFQYLTEIFEKPLEDASEIIYDRLPVSNFYETHKNDGKERYLKSRINPPSTNEQPTDGHMVSDDAPVSMFMRFLVKSVVNYND